jgi:phosphoribosylformylglycinamidine synthase
VTATPEHDPLDDAPSTTCPVTVCDLPIEALTHGAPAYDRPQADAPAPLPPSLPSIHGNLREELLELCASPNIGSRAWVYRQYDHIVRGGSVLRPGSDAAVVRVLCERDAKGTLAPQDGRVTEKFLAFSVDCNGRHVESDPFHGAAMAVAEACRNLVCSGAEPLALTDCLNFGNPERKEVMRSFARAVDGIAAACTALGVPIVSGNVSLYNETDGKAILPTPTIGAVGLVQSEGDIVTQWWKRPGDVVLLLGVAAPGSKHGAAGLAGSEYAALLEKRAPGPAPVRLAGSGFGSVAIDLDMEAKLQKLVLALARARGLESAHDVSEGGLAIALAECATSAPSSGADVGARIDLEMPGGAGVTPVHTASLLFGEHPTRVVVSVKPDRVAEVRAAAETAGVPCAELGVTGGDSLSIALVAPRALGTAQAIAASLVVGVSELRKARAGCLSGIVGD